MSDLISAPEARRPRRRHVPRRISMPDGEVMETRRQFAEEELSVCDRTATRINLPTIYIGGHAYIARNASLENHRRPRAAPQPAGEAAAGVSALSKSGEARDR